MIVICQEGSKTCLNKNELARHMKTHTGEKEHGCRHEGCGKMFSHAQTRDIHEKIHKGIKDYQCTMCPKQFTQKSQLTVHVKRHMGIKEHECTVCGRAYVEPAGARKCCHSKKDSTRPSRPKWAPPPDHMPDRIPQQTPDRMPYHTP